MSYLVLARKWRPRTFSDLVGQEHVAQTLRNAITQGRVAHAFLFTGARGVGKTTIARIMAKALNCLGRDGASTEPCLECAACTEITLGRDPDVAEIDGASNNSVEDVRRLQETLPYRPSRDRFKVVIIDEVHMLSTGAFNALLKTLEEPPPHVKFIFATTEVHKVPITILSRCQRYDFRLIPTQRIRERVAHILTQEGLRFDEAAVSLVSREAAGSMRDALSLLDQVIAGVEGELTGAAAARLLGVADRKVLYELVRMILDGDAPGALETLALIAREGYDLPNVARAVHGVIRDLVVARVVSQPGELLDLADEERAEVRAIAARFDAVDIERLFVAWAKVSDDVARSREARWTLEMAAVRLAHRPALLPVDELLGRLRELEQRVSSGVPPPAGGDGPRGGGRPPAAPTGPAAPPPPQRPPAGAAPTTAPAGRFSAPQRRDDVPRSAAETPPPSAKSNAAVAPRADAFAERLRVRAAEPRAEAVAAQAPAPVAAPMEPTVDVGGSAEAMGVWTALVTSIDGPLVPVLKGAVPLVVTAALVRLAIDTRDSFFRRKLATPEAQSAVADGAERFFGARPAVELVQGVLPEAAPTIARAEEDARQSARKRREDVAKSHPLVALVCELLQGDIARVRLDDDPV
jgi:DNA polymerase-3 subunit gamma/tau